MVAYGFLGFGVLLFLLRFCLFELMVGWLVVACCFFLFGLNLLLVCWFRLLFLFAVFGAGFCFVWLDLL